MMPSKRPLALEPSYLYIKRYFIATNHVCFLTYIQALRSFEAAELYKVGRMIQEIVRRSYNLASRSDILIMTG